MQGGGGHLLAGEGNAPVAEVDGVARDNVEDSLVLLSGTLERAPSRVHVVEQILRLFRSNDFFLVCFYVGQECGDTENQTIIQTAQVGDVWRKKKTK